MDLRERNRIYDGIYRKSFNGLIAAMYGHQKENCIKRNQPLQNYTKDDLEKWVLSQPNFKILYNNWVDSGYKKALKPSCDRLDDYKSYTFDNLRLVTWDENNKKGHLDRINGINNKQSKAVLQFDLEGNFIREYYSLAEAYRVTGINKAMISRVCNKERNKTNGYIWKFKKTII